MILFFGKRPGKTEIFQLSNAKCPYCEQMGTLALSKTSNWFHFFWIKIFRISSHVVAECAHCKRAYYENEFTKEMKTGIENARTTT